MLNTRSIREKIMPELSFGSWDIISRENSKLWPTSMSVHGEDSFSWIREAMTTKPSKINGGRKFF